MKIRNVKHKGLRRFYETGRASGLPSAVVPKVIDILTFLEAMGAEDELHELAFWKPHRMGGDRQGTWALHVTRNWRMTFMIDATGIEIIDLDYEDYH